MKMLKEYVHFILENDISFADIYNSYADSQQVDNEDQQDNEEDQQTEKKDDINILADPYEYINFPRKNNS